ncbi:MAG: dephospho-CoA kinase, partial [Pseudomonadota bacterium]
VAKNREDFLEEQRAGGADMALCDIPLLFETGGQGEVDVIVVVTAPEEVRKSRVLKRPQMTAEKYEAIRARQWPDEKRRAHADYLIHTDQDVSYTEAQVLTVLNDIREKKASLS